MLSLLLAGCCATVLYTRVYLTFDRVRITVVTTEQQVSEGAVVVPLPNVSRLAGLPTALILNLRNAAPDPRVASVTLAGSELAQILIDPSEDVRTDVSLPADARITRGDRLELGADGAQFPREDARRTTTAGSGDDLDSEGTDWKRMAAVAGSRDRSPVFHRRTIG